MKDSKIKLIPKYIQKLIRKRDKKDSPKQDGSLRYYAYLTKNSGELVKVTVAVRNRRKQWYCKQVAVHGVHSDKCFVKDMVFHYLSGYRVGWYDMGFYSNRRWYETDEWGWSEDRYFDPYAPVVNIEYLSKFPEYRYSAWQLYSGADILGYLRLYEKYPQAEYLMKLGLEKYVFSKQILVKAAKDKRFRKWLSANRKELAEHYYYISAVLSAYRRNASLVETQRYEVVKKPFCRENSYKPVREMLGRDYRPYFEYVSKQNISHRLYLDYLKACKYLGLDMSEPKNRYPRDFKYWHDIRTDQYATSKVLKDEEERKELYLQFSAIADKYLPLQQESNKSSYICIIAKSPAELIHEGEALHHCVGRMGYERKFIREETLIFFIRSKESPDIPLVTVEYSLPQKKVLQCYASNNSTPEESILHYVDRVWLPYANRALKQIRQNSQISA